MLARTVTPQCDAGRAHEAQAADQSGASNLRDTQNHRGAGLRPDQTGSRVSPVPLARLGKSPGRVGAGLSYPQHFEVASALLCLTILQAATRKCRCKTAHLFTVASRPAGASQNPFPTRFINS